MVTKGGTNQLHGSGWYAGRRTTFTANTYFNNEGGLVRPVYNINIEGFSIGGPVVIPKLYNGRNKLFFFGSEEYTNDQRPVSPVTAFEPTAAQLNGDFSSTYATNGTLLPIIDPLTGKQFPGNIISGQPLRPSRAEDAEGSHATQRLHQHNSWTAVHREFSKPECAAALPPR